MQLDFTGRTVLVTGAAQGIGRGIAHAFAADGADVWAVDRDEATLDATALTAPRPLTCRCLDVTAAGAIDEVVAAAGGVDIAIHVAGGVGGQVGRPVETITDADWEAIVAVNQTAAFRLARAVAPGMKAKGWGRIVTITSRAGLRVSLTGIQAYASAKAGQIGLVRQLGHELGAFGITVNAIAPGFLRTNPTTERQWEAMGPEGQARLIQGIALRRLGRPEDIANAARFLASEAASWITGQVLSVDGGE
ncbi:MAG: SDR family oxidoreductase [Geminicoccaceae bacterium]|nr:MAG: SDR family oxidoreductase [Geminicoccaceae bacterium]